MPTFDSQVQLLKHKVLTAVAKRAYEGRLDSCYYEIPQEIAPGPKAEMRCCIYKERAIVGERIKMAMGGHPENPNVIEVMSIACDECPASGYTVGEDCRGCIAHRCAAACPKDAISFEGHKARIDKSKCIGCGCCAAACPYSAIDNKQRPCEIACKVKAVSMGPTGEASIDNSKCISCGACAYKCPFGAIADKSYILDVIRLIQESGNNQNYRVYALVAPAIASQFGVKDLGKAVSALKVLGFHHVVEVALGADMVAHKEAAELVEKGFLTSSCCPAFVDYIEKFFPQMKEHVSHNYSPMAELASYIRKTDPNCRIVFIGPCTAKKMEIQREKVKGLVDYVLTFEELQALFDAREIDLSALPDEPLDNASYFGRIFARSGGLADAVAEALKEQGVTPDQFTLKAVSCDGIEACRMALLKASKNALPENFIEGMACIGGCIGGAGCLTHEPKDKAQVDQYGKLAMEKTIADAIKPYSI